MFKSPDDIIGLSSKENNNDNTAYSRNNYDALNRVTSVELPGKAWRDDNRRNISEYSTNAEKEVLHYMANPNGKFSLVKPNDNKSNPYQYYPAGSLIKEVSIDADNKKSETYKDLFGNIILQRMYDGNTKLDTYYVYDDLNRLCYVLSPQYQKTGTKAINCYEYRYDYRGRIVKKILPGCSYIQYWYDNADRLICMQDGVMRENHKYRFYMYDNLGRMVIQGLYPYWNYNSTFFKSNSAITTFNKESDGFCGTGYVVPSKFIEDPTKAILEIVNYYDGNQTLIKNKEFAKNFNNLSLNSTVCQIGQLTGNVTLAGSMEAGNAEYLAQAMEYDLRGNLTIAKSRLFGGKIVSSKNTYTYTNQLSIACDTIDVGYGKKLITYNSKGYNVNNNKMSSHYISICHGSNIFTANLKYYYDALGRLSTVTRPFTSDVNCNINYSYDIHGWLKKITTNSFTEELFYADGEGTKYYNGNISSVKWKDNSKSISNLIRGYRYSYDDVNRMTSGIYGEGTELSSNLDKYSEYVSYDPNGNIIKLTRHGRYSTSGSGYGIMDSLTISYNGNQPLSVSEISADSDFSSSFEYKRSNGTGYKFNANGSLYADKSRCIAYIKYDYNNNPTMIYFTNGNTTEYIYSAAGQKLRAIHNTCKPNVLTRKFGEEATGKLPPKYILQTDTIQYLLGGAIVMINGRIDKYLFEGGYAQATPKDSDNDTFAYYYYNQDHLGNNREVVDASGVVKQVTNYFPFGATYADRNAEKGTNIQEYKYNGKELDRMHGLNTYDYGARQHDPILGRWDRIDPLCEKYYSTSPYVYCMNNPVMCVDPDGRKTKIVTDSTGHVTITTEGVLVNNSDKNYDMQKVLNAIVNEIQSRFTNSDLNVEMVLKLRVVDPNNPKDVENVKSDDNIFEIVNQDLLGDALAKAERGGLRIHYGTEAIDGLLYGYNTRTTSHEMGHILGLKDTPEGLVCSNLDNLMTQTIFLRYCRIPNFGVVGTITERQLNTIQSATINHSGSSKRGNQMIFHRKPNGTLKD